MGAAGLAFAAVLATAQQPPPSPPTRLQGVTVSRVLMEIRVLDGQGRPVKGLGPADIQARVEGKPVEVESLEWIGAPGSVLVPAPDGASASAPRSVVFLFQKELDGSRNAGFLRMARRAEDVIDSLAPGDRVAVASFDVHLRLWQDLTADRERLHQAIEDGVVLNRRPKDSSADEGPALEEGLDETRARRATSLEKALLVVGEALSGLPGDRSLVLVASHMGRNPRIPVDEAYAKAHNTLASARVAVYSLDITEADHHTLELGLQAVAEGTGGFYARTHDFAAGATRRLEGALEGHYLLTFPKPEGEPGFHPVELRLAHGEGTIFARPGYRD